MPKPRFRRPSRRGIQNKKYRKTEEAILDVLLESKEMPSVKEITKKAHISRSTLYRHHRAMPGIIPDYEREILLVFRRSSAKILRQTTSLESIYLRMLIFILRHKRVFVILFRYSGDRVAENMVFELKDVIAKARHLPPKSDQMFKIYAKEVAGVIEAWGIRGFPEHEINQIQKDILYLTTTMRQRLSPINH